MANILQMLYTSIFQKLGYFFASIRQYVSCSTVVTRQNASAQDECLPFATAPLLEQTLNITSMRPARSNKAFDSADPEMTALRTIEDPTNLIGWTLSTALENVDEPLLIDASDPARFVTRRKAITLTRNLTGGFEPDTTVCLHLLNDILYPVLVLSILASNCRWTGTNTAYTSYELEHHFRSAKTKYVITRPEHVPTVAAACEKLDWKIEIVLFNDVLEDQASNDASSNAETFSRGVDGFRTLHGLIAAAANNDTPKRDLQPIHPDQIAVLQSTSGTTGLPKMAARTHRAVILESKAIEDDHLKKPYQVRRLFCTPIFHAFSFPEMVVTPLRLGIPTYFMRRYDDTFARKVFEHQITETAAPPPMLKMLQKRSADHHLLQSLRLVFTGGAPLAPALRGQVLTMFANPPRLVQVWGMTEGGWFTTFKHPENDGTGSVGRAVPGLEIKASSNNQLSLPDGGQVGELLVRGPQVMPAYFGNEEASQAAFEHGWLRTGDVGYIDDGKVYLIDRCKDLIKVNGWQVSPAEIEAAVLDLSGIDDAAAIAVGHGVHERPLLFVVPSRKDDVSREVVMNHLGRRLARHKISKIEVDLIDTIPRNASGKVLRKVLKEEATQRGLMHGME